MQRYVLIWGARLSRPSLSGTQSHHTDLVTEGLAPSSHSRWGFPLGALAFPAPPGSFSPFSRLAVDSAFLHRTDRCLCQEPRLFPLGSPGRVLGLLPLHPMPAPGGGGVHAGEGVPKDRTCASSAVGAVPLTERSRRCLHCRWPRSGSTRSGTVARSTVPPPLARPGGLGRHLRNLLSRNLERICLVSMSSTCCSSPSSGRRNKAVALPT